MIFFILALFFLLANNTESIPSIKMNNSNKIGKKIKKQMEPVNPNKDFIEFRGLYHKTPLRSNFQELGGSKIFPSNLRNDNIKNNKVDYNNYSSYRVKKIL